MASSRSRGAPSTFSGRGHQGGAMKFTAATRRTMEAQAWREVADARRAEVYRTDVPFTGLPTRPWKRRTPQEKLVLVERLRELRGALGWTLEQCANELDMNPTTVSTYCREAGITKGEKK